MRIILLLLPFCLLALTEARKVQIRARVSEPQLYYEEEEDGQGAEEEYVAPIYQPRTRALPSPRSKDTLHGSKPPPVQTIRNYNKVNDDGSFTFGYEAADGSFKEETRGTDCVVRGKYGYIDPDGNKREFTYVSGNPCDPNAPKDEDDDDVAQKEDDDISGPANYPAVRPVARPRPRPTYATTTPRAPTTIFQSEYQLDDDASQELEEQPKNHRPQSFRRPQPQYIQVSPADQSNLYQSTPSPNPQLYRIATTQYPVHTTPAPHHTQPSIASTVYKPVESSTRAALIRQRPQSVAITPRPHVSRVAAQYVSPSSTERPGIVFAPRTTPIPSTTAAPSSQNLDYAAELERYVNSVASPRPVQKPKQASQSEPIYQSELVYDPSTGQYNTQLYQSLPQTVGDFSLSHKLQPYVAQQQQQQQHQQQQQSHLAGLQHLQHQSPLYRQAQVAPAPTPSSQVARQPQEAIFRKQQAQLLQQSQQLYAQQKRRQQLQQQHQQLQSQQHQQLQPQQPQRYQLIGPDQKQHPFYYVSPHSQAAAAPISAGQIDQFLRGNANSF